MKKKIDYPKCEKTVSGKHNFVEHLHNPDDPDEYMDLEHPMCSYCEMIDDTIDLKQEDQPEARVAYS